LPTGGLFLLSFCISDPSHDPRDACLFLRNRGGYRIPPLVPPPHPPLTFWTSLGHNSHHQNLRRSPRGMKKYLVSLGTPQTPFLSPPFRAKARWADCHFSREEYKAPIPPPPSSCSSGQRFLEPAGLHENLQVEFLTTPRIRISELRG